MRQLTSNISHIECPFCSGLVEHKQGNLQRRINSGVLEPKLGTMKCPECHDLFLEKIDRDVLDDPRWAKLSQLETIRNAMFTVKVHERIREIDKEAD